MSTEEFNKINHSEAKKALLFCCTSQKWANTMMTFYPFSSEKEMVKHAIEIWYNECGMEDFLEAFTHHPEIGDIKSLQEKYAGQEQASISEANNETIQTLMDANKEYKEKFGFIFIVCATGKSAVEMLQLLHCRLENTVEEEINIAMGEQMKITTIRLQKMVQEADWTFLKASQITTHVLDTSYGKPGKNICIRLQKKMPTGWQTMSQGITNADGRVPDLLPPERILPKGSYNVNFDTQTYYNTQNTACFYPEVNIQFNIWDENHYHIPLLISPFGYTTYRGS